MWQSQSVNHQVETESREGRGHRSVSCCADDGLDAVLQRGGRVNSL